MRITATPSTSARPSPAQPPARAPSRSVVTRATPPSHRSFDGEEELDAGLGAELARLVDPDRARRQAAHLELVLNVSKRPRPETCDCCSGGGTSPCGFCHGSGALTVGADRFCSLAAGCRDCPACNGRGAVPCHACKGTGRRAAWLGPGCPAE